MSDRVLPVNSPSFPLRALGSAKGARSAISFVIASSQVLLWLLICVAAGSLIPCAVADSAFPTDQSFRLQSGQFRTLHSAKEVPIDVLKKCFPNGAPADPEKPWNPTDAVQDASLPFSRVIWLATDGPHWLFAWEHGGIVHSFGFMLVLKTEGAPTVIWDAGDAKKPLNSFKDFQEYVRAECVFHAVSSFRP
jgi:hypothetical protein